jgi:hypothetical protein
MVKSNTTNGDEMSTATEILSAAFPSLDLIVEDGHGALAQVAGRTYSVRVYPAGAISAARGPHGLYLCDDAPATAVAALRKDAGRAADGMGTDYPRVLLAD